MSVVAAPNYTAHSDAYLVPVYYCDGTYCCPICTNGRAPSTLYNPHNIQLGSINLYDAIGLLCDSPHLESVKFLNVLYNSTSKLPSMRTERWKLPELRSFTMLGGDCHFMDLLDHFVFPFVQKLTLICDARMQSYPPGSLTCNGVPYATHTFQNFLVGSSSLLQELTLQDLSEECVDLHLPQVMQFLAQTLGGVALWNLKSLNLPLVIDIAENPDEDHFLEELAVQLERFWVKKKSHIIKREGRNVRGGQMNPSLFQTRAMPTPRHITLRMESDARRNVPPYGCGSRKQHQLAPDGSRQIVACSQCPEKRIGYSAQKNFRKYANKGEWKVDIRINERVVVHNL
ncbi:hypothetical protein AX17_003628 [Amanita inopinata Kibby_2008]|nr:hypothetical protein AX17_003628 [Amanita inopinata Kibby_2008]